MLVMPDLASGILIVSSKIVESIKAKQIGKSTPKIKTVTEI